MGRWSKKSSSIWRTLACGKEVDQSTLTMKQLRHSSTDSLSSLSFHQKEKMAIESIRAFFNDIQAIIVIEELEEKQVVTNGFEMHCNTSIRDRHDDGCCSSSNSASSHGAVLNSGEHPSFVLYQWEPVVCGDISFSSIYLWFIGRLNPFVLRMYWGVAVPRT
ncbi:hypothetical protein Cgig2_023889 [Carnegiea gigantea]|uniref:Uncharacterized protein n=1 Tax=Carnegiea gigantea TaxID=171969 RepID=A0A9Q1GV32_9CARY|nr:hypothetical protein Cgig2_023889 [Carnegiea gigantea]